MKAKIRLHSLGVKQDYPMSKPEPEKMKVETTFPTFSLNSAQVPMVNRLQRGDKCSIILEAEVTGTREAERWDDTGKDWKGEVNAQFKLLKGSVQALEQDHKTTDQAYEAARKSL